MALNLDSTSQTTLIPLPLPPYTFQGPYTEDTPVNIEYYLDPRYMQNALASRGIKPRPASTLNPLAPVFHPEKYHKLKEVFDGQWMRLSLYGGSPLAVHNVINTGGRGNRRWIHELYWKIAQFLAGTVPYGDLERRAAEKIRKVFYWISKRESDKSVCLHSFAWRVYSLFKVAR